MSVPAAQQSRPSDPRVAAARHDLEACVPADVLTSEPDVMAGYLHDEAEWAPYGAPLAVARPRTAAQVQALVRVCAAHGVPVVPRGAGTGLSGGANALDDALVLSTARMRAIREIDPVERLAVVEPGVVNDDLRAAAAEQGLWYPPDPASSPWSTIGGNVATNAGGLCCVKYGVTRDYVLALQVVTGTGELVRLGHRTAKGVAGYDFVGLLVGSEGTLGVITEVTVRLRPARAAEVTVAGYDFVGLLVGSEGTLGVITEVTVRLRPARAAEVTVAGYFPSLVSAGRAVAAVGAAGITPSALELVDRTCLEAVDAWKNMGLSVDAEVVLLGRSDAPGAAGAHEAAAMLTCFEQAGATWAARSSDPEEAEALFAARRLAYPAVERLGDVLTEDVCVPTAAVPEMLARIQEAAERNDTRIANVAHAGDGNLHPVMITERGDATARTRAQAAFAQIIGDALALGGTVTGEHGVGLLKRDGLAREVGPEVLALHRAVKAALDPLGILNPGKAF